MDTTSQGFPYQTEIFLLNKFDVFTEIRVTPPDILLSQKLFAAVNRKKPKGRDFYDITFLSSRTKPNYDFLQMKLGIKNEGQLKEELQPKMANYDFKAIAQDVAPFLMNQNEIKRVEKFQIFWDQVNFE